MLGSIDFSIKYFLVEEILFFSFIYGIIEQKIIFLNRLLENQF